MPLGWQADKGLRETRKPVICTRKCDWWPYTSCEGSDEGFVRNGKFMRKGIKNYRARAEGMENNSQKIQWALSRVGAKRVFFEYGKNGRMEGIGFIIETPHGEFPVQLPARIDKVAQIMYKKPLKELNESQELQSYVTAWANIRDWVDAQCALIETEMVKTEEVFLPYFTDKEGKTFFESIEHQGFHLGAGKSEEGKVVGGVS